MNKLKEDIKNNSFSNFYLLSGEDSYLKNLYLNKLKKAILGEDETMNYSYFEGKGVSELDVLDVANTMPFFADKRLIVVRDSNWCKQSNSFADKAVEIPDTTIIVFVESDIDKKTKLYKFISSNGYVAELNGYETSELLAMVFAYFKQKGILINKSDCQYFIEKIGTDMARIQTELDKLYAYSIGFSEIKKEDIDIICSEIPEGKIFQMLDALLSGSKDRAYMLYTELIEAQEKPMSILFMLNRNYNQLYQTLVLSKEGLNKQRICQVTGMRDFMVDKFLRLKNSYSIKKLREIIDYGLMLENQIKIGDMNETIAVEMFIVGN